MDSLKGQIAVVTGASSGIGKAIALSVAGHGAEVFLVARRRELLEGVAKQIHALGSRGHACPADLTKDDDIIGLGARFQKDFGHVNILVLCGGAIFHGRLEKASLADFDLMYRSNVRGHYFKSSSSILPPDSVPLPPPDSFPQLSMRFAPSPTVCATKSMPTAFAS